MGNAHQGGRSPDPHLRRREGPTLSQRRRRCGRRQPGV